MLLDGGEKPYGGWNVHLWLSGKSGLEHVPFFSHVSDDLSAFGSSMTFGQLRRHSGDFARFFVIDDVTSQLPYSLFF